MNTTYSLSILISCIDNNVDNLLQTCNSITEELETFHEQLHLNIICSSDTEFPENFDSLLEKIRCKCQVDLSVSSYKNALEIYQNHKNQAASRYIQFLESGFCYAPGSIKAVLSCIDKASSQTVFTMGVCPFDSQNITYHPLPLCLSSGIFRSDLAQNYDFDTSAPYDGELLFVWNFAEFDSNSSTTINESSILLPTQSIPTNYKFYTPAQDKDWYTKTLSLVYLPLLESYAQKQMAVPRSIQYLFLFAIKSRFESNKNLNNKQIFSTDDEWKEFKDLIIQFLNGMDDTMLTNVDVDSAVFRLAHALTDLLLNWKYTELSPNLTFYKTANNLLQGYFNHEDCCYHMLSQSKITIDAMNYEDSALILDLSFLLPVSHVDYDIHAYFDGETDTPLNLVPVERYGALQYFGRTFFHANHYQLCIPKDCISGAPKHLLFKFAAGNQEIPLSIATGRFPSRVTSLLKHSYWIFDNNIVYLHQNFATSFCKQDVLSISKCKKHEHLKAELHLLKEILSKSERMFLFRCRYWIHRLFTPKRHKWIMFDKMYKAGDNGEYLYKYIEKQHDGIKPYYLVTKGYPDTKRLKKEHCSLLYYGSFRHRFHFLTSEIIAATHANIPVFSGFKTSSFPYVQDLLEAKITCIQHGLTVQMIPHNQNRVYDNLKRYYLASPAELTNLKQPDYGFTNHLDLLKMVGLARYDGLKNNDQKQILLIPTWRNYIAMPTSIGNVRPYSTTFKETVYYKTFQSLINNKKLLDTCRKYGYRFVYVPHPTVASQVEDFYSDDPLVEIQTPIGLDYEKILTESSLMITDYSGVQFDFSYMRKPIVYYHPTELPAHYEEGGFCYDSQGFGDICTDEDTLVETLCRYIENQCQVTPFYLERENSFFAFDDAKNCKRIYDDLLELSKEV